jgi:F-type H+-transporting ATPase subunit delta
MAVGRAERRFVALRYAEGFYEAARRERRLDEGLAFVEHLAEVLESYPDFLKILEHPQVTRSEKERLLRRAAAKYTEPAFVALIGLVLRRGRVRLIREIAARYREKWEAEHGILRGEVRTALPLEPRQRERLEELFSRRRQKKVVLEERLDPEAIGGIAVILEGKILDATLKNQLENLKQSLLSEEFWKRRGTG